MIEDEKKDKGTGRDAVGAQIDLPDRTELESQRYMIDGHIEGPAQAVCDEPRRSPKFVNGLGCQLPVLGDAVGLPPPHRDVIHAASRRQPRPFIDDREIRFWLDVDQGRVVRLQAEELVLLL